MNGTDAGEDRLSVSLRAATRDLHATAERSGIMHGFLRGRIERQAYIALLRALHPVYAALEAGLDACPDLTVRFPELYRTPALEADLAALHGSGWASAVTVAPSARTLAGRIGDASADAPARLVAHAYVRYMGDLSGGTALGALVRRALGADLDAGTAFYVFPEPGPDAWKARFRDALDAMPAAAPTAAAIVEEACAAFRLHITLFEEIEAQASS